MKTIAVEIKGMCPGILMHRFPLVPVEGMDKKSPQEQAEHAAYRDVASGELFIPGTAIQRAIISGATYSKGKGRASLQKQAAACVFVRPEVILLGVKEFIVDSRPVVVPATKGRVVRHRPFLPEWECAFEIDYDEILLKETEIRKMIDDTGSRVGLLDFRPACKGPFGRFMVTKWKEKNQ